MPLVSWQKSQANLNDLQALRDFIREHTLAYGFNDSDIFDLNLAVTEAVTNIILHGYRGESGPVTVAIDCQVNRLIVQIQDQAPLFDPSVIPSPDLSIPLEKRPLGGMGIHLIKTSVDQVSYQRLPQGGNLLKLQKICSFRPSNQED